MGWSESSGMSNPSQSIALIFTPTVDVSYSRNADYQALEPLNKASWTLRESAPEELSTSSNKPLEAEAGKIASNKQPLRPPSRSPLSN